MVPYGGPGGKASSPYPSSGPPQHDLYSSEDSRGKAPRALGGELASPPRLGSRSPSPPYTHGSNGRYENSTTPPRGAESYRPAGRVLGGSLSYPGWLYGSGVGMSDPFPSMWCSALFLHVHPKKQVTASPEPSSSSHRASLPLV